MAENLSVTLNVTWQFYNGFGQFTIRIRLKYSLKYASDKLFLLFFVFVFFWEK